MKKSLYEYALKHGMNRRSFVKGAASGLPNGYDNLLVGGVNAPTYANYPAIQQYVTAFSEITSGTTTTTTAAVTAVDTDRTGW